MYLSIYLVFNFNLQNLFSASSVPLHSSPSQNIDKLTTPINSESGNKMKEEMEVLTQQQHLINQYMHLNIQLLSQKLDNL
jgi:hypothetical protein